MKIEERLIRREPEDIIEIGRIVENFWRGESGTIVLCLINALINEATQYSNEKDVNAVIRFGRVKALEDLKMRIEQTIADKEDFLKPLNEEKS